jgi:PAS domain S-box-containing protein
MPLSRLKPLIQPFRLLSQCRLCWRITLAVFLAIFAVEAAILIPSYQNYERDLLARLNEVGRGVMLTALVMRGNNNERDLLITGTGLTGISNIRGGAIYFSDGAAPRVFGEAPQLTLERVRAGAASQGYAARRTRYEAMWSPAETGFPFTVVGRMDSTSIRGELIAFLWRIGGLILLISSFVCVVTMLILGRYLLLPLLKIRDNLAQALGDPSRADQFVLTETGNDELGEVVSKLNQMLERVSKTYREELATMLSMVDRSAEGMLVYDSAGRIVYANQGCVALFGFDDIDDLRASEGPRFQIPGRPARLHLIDLLSDGPFSGEVRLFGKDDSAVPCMLSGGRLEDGEGRPFRYFATMTDISELREVHDNLEQQNMELAASNRAKSQFLANMSHELRTPLNAIIGFSEIMHGEIAGPLDNPQYKEFCHHIHESGTHLLELINDILDLSKIEAGKFELEEEDFDPERIIQASLRLLHGRAALHAIELEIDCDDDLPWLRADQRKVKQVLINLLSNAVKFTPDGGKVVVGAKIVSGGDLAIVVRDTGVGINEHDLPRIFAPFVQVDGSLSRRHDGTGLGLPLTKAIVEMHQGVLDIESEIGVGTTVTARFPRERLVAHALNTEPDRAAASA